MTSCPHCKATAWKIEQIQPSGARFVYNSVQCADCSAPAGVMDYGNIGFAVEKLEQKVDAIAANLDALGYTLSQIAQRLER